MPLSPSMVVATLAGTAAYLALAIAGWGGIGPYFAHPARAAIVIVTFLLSVAALFSGGNLSPGEREDRGNRWVLAAFGAIGLLQGFLPAYTDRKGLWTIDGDAARWCGVALFVLGGVLRLWPVFVLGRRFSGLVAIQRDHRLVTSGVYRHIRNPSYLGLLVGSVGWALAFRSWAGLLLVACMIPVLVGRIRSEEALLLSHFGREYELYRRRTWRLLPGVY